MRRVAGTTALAAVLVLFAGSGVAQALTPRDAALEAELDRRIEAPALGRDVTMAVEDVGTDEEMYDHFADERQLPASTMKVVTAANALMNLGRGHRFVTRVVQGEQKDSIILVGGGDPLLTAADLRRLAQRTAAKLARADITRVVLEVDDYLFPRPTEAQGWEPGDSPTYASAVRPLGLLGEYSMNTAASATALFADALNSQGISVRRAGRAVADGGAPTLAAVDEHTVGEAVALMLLISENNVAEVLFRQVALARGYPATWSGSSAAAKETLRELGLRTWDLELIDGSGLSMDDRVTARLLTDLLDRVVDPAWPALRPIRGWLPVAGSTGTLTRRFSAPPADCARGKVFAKTGSLTGVSTLAGLTRGPDGRWRSFAIMVNQRPESQPWTSTSQAIDTLAATVNGCA